MTDPLICTSWPIQLTEPASADPVDRIRVQEEYLGKQLSPWLIDVRPTWIDSLHSVHFMRYLDPTHLDKVKGIVIEFRLLGSAAVLSQAEPDVDQLLSGHKTQQLVTEYYRKAQSDWEQTTLATYGGSQASRNFATFLASAS